VSPRGNFSYLQFSSATPFWKNGGTGGSLVNIDKQLMLLKIEPKWCRNMS
jgi:hypothetical protein